MAVLHSIVGNASEIETRGREFETQPFHLTFMEINLKMFSAAIFFHLVIQEEQLAVNG